jgi:hypothetical protein
VGITVNQAYMPGMAIVTVHKNIVPAEFPELAMLVWNRNPDRPIAAEEAFALYERNWPYVDKTHLTPKESELIRELVEKFGKGRLLTG